MTFLYRTAKIAEYSEENFTKELKKLPLPLADYAKAAKEGEGRARRLAGMQALAACLSYLSVTPPPIAVGTYGKPDFTEGEYHFNISHAGGLAVAVLAPQPIGVDLEPCDREIPEARRVRLLSSFSEAERRAVHAKTPGDQARAFLVTWVKKEAYIKRGGRGLADLCEADTAAEPPALFEILSEDGRDYFLAVY